MTATLAAPASTAPEPGWRSRLQPLAGPGGWWATLAVTLLAGALRFFRLAEPKGKIFDEIYYACDAHNLIRFGVEQATRSDPKNPAVAAACIPTGQPGFVVHPPLGKWLIGAGEQLFGMNEFGWRFAAAVAGTVTVLLLVRLARRMTGSTLLGSLAGVLLALDGLEFVQSRVAMLDIFVLAFLTATVACLLVDRDRVRVRLSQARAGNLVGWGPRLGFRPWLLAAGVCLGAALATKWSALYYVPLLALIAFGWEVSARRTAGVGAPWRAVARRSLLPLLVTLAVLPAALYVLSWAGWFLTSSGWDRHWAAGQPGGTGLLPDALRSWWHYQVEIYRFHTSLETSHPYQSHPLGWLLLARPVSYYYPPGITAGQFGCTVSACSREVLAIGTPAIWWAGIPALVGCAWWWLTRRDWRALTAVLLVLVAIVPWIPSDLHHRTMFLFYFLPGVPFLALALALMAGRALGPAGASRRRRAVGAAAVGSYLALVVLNFAYLYPVLAAQTIPYPAWHARMWFPSWI